MTIHRLKLKDLNPEYIQYLREQYGDEEVELEIRVSLSSPTEANDPSMTEKLFWEIIDLFDWKQEGNDDKVIEPAVMSLSELPEDAIYTFFDILSEKLYLLDGQKYAEHSTDDNLFSSDLFLYARCCVVANGKVVYERVLNNPSTFPKDLFFEILLKLPEKAYLRKTGKPFNYLPRYIYETGFNPDGWGNQTIKL